TLTNLAGGVIAGSSYGVENYNGTIGTLTNSGLISGGTDGIYNDGTIGLLTNLAGGTIYGGGTSYNSAGITNENLIGVLDNSGLIRGAHTGVYNYYRSTIGTLTNSGTVTGAYNGIANYGTIGLINNLASGVIQSTANNDSGILNEGTIGALTNSGLIYGPDSGVDNYYGTIFSLTNNAGGNIEGGYYGIYNYGNMPQLTNNGVISGTNYGVYAVSDGNSSYTIGTLTNSGTISGHTGVYIADRGTTIVNMGTIASTDGGNAIDLENNYNSLILNTGSVLFGTIYGGGYNNSITLEGMDSMSNTIADFGTGSTLTVAPGANWAADGSWTVPNVYNYGTFEPGFITGNGVTSTPLTLNGNFTMESGSTYVVLVTPATSSVLDVTGTATLTGTV
ncbi:MAG: hypothetical protein P4N41_10740, partial [Negativicutes bacterium]|nr:hypothetical protein [Negativicutes bacterium]